jgi:hypothetical protein
MKFTSYFANSTIVFGLISIISLVALHFTSSEFKPNFRMVSEYALGNYKWLLSIFFFSWALCNISSALMFWEIASTFWAKFAVVLIFISGIGAFMGGMFDVQHKLHGLSFAIGVPFMPIAALILSYHLIKKVEWQNYSIELLISSHSIWISLIFMAFTMFLLFSSLKTAGIAFGPDAAPLNELPDGVIGINGWANRLLVLCYLAYPILCAKINLNIIKLEI